MNFIFSSKFEDRRYYKNKFGKYVSDFHSSVDITYFIKLGAKNYDDEN